MKDRFVLISRWLLDCDINQAWQRIAAIRHWQAWWPNVGAVRVLDDSDDDTPRVGRSAWVDWKTRLGYGLRLRVTTTGVIPPFELEGTAEGDLTGRGLWVLEAVGSAGVMITYRWDVHLNRRWMRFCSPLLRPIFAWIHFGVMRSGAKAMARAIGCRVLRYQDYTFTPGSSDEDLGTLRWPEPFASPPTNGRSR